MTSGIPNYSQTDTLSRPWIEEPRRDLSAEDLVRIAYPTGSNDLPAATRYQYFNTSYILAGMIAG